MKTEFSESSDRQAGAKLILYERAWYKKGELSRQPDRRIRIPDFDVAGDVNRYLSDLDKEEVRRNSIRTRSDAMYTLTDLKEQFNPDTPDGDFLIRKIRSLKARSRAQERMGTFTFDQYLEETMGLDCDSVVAPSLVPEQDIDNQHAKVEEVFSRLGFDYTRYGWEKFVAENSLSGQAMVTQFQEFAEDLAPVMRQAIGLDLKPNYELEKVEEPAYWVCWVSGDSNGYTMEINTHERAVARSYRGVPGRLITHELLTHLFQIESIKRNIESDVINPGYGITTVPGAEQPPFEGLANTITLFIPELRSRMTDYERFSVEQVLLEDMVFRNLHILANRNPGRMHEYFTDVTDRLPNSGNLDRERILSERTTDPSLRAYLLAYGYSHEFAKYADRLSFSGNARDEAVGEDDKRIDFVRASFARPLSMLQTDNLVTELCYQRSNSVSLQGKAV